MYKIFNYKYVKDLTTTQEARGYTIIEMLLYIAIFSLIIGSILSVAMSIADQRIQNQATQEVDYQGNMAINSITQSLRNASSINTPTPTNTSSSISFNLPVTSNNPIVYDVIGEQGVNRLHMRMGTTSPEYLTNTRVSITNLSISNRAISGGKDSIYISFTLTYHNPTNKPQLSYQKNFYGVTTLR